MYDQSDLFKIQCTQNDCIFSSKNSKQVCTVFSICATVDIDDDGDPTVQFDGEAGTKAGKTVDVVGDDYM